jgi:shikimate kinase
VLGNVRGRMKLLIDERTPVYESVAQHTVDTDGLTVDEVAARVRALVEDDAHD